MQLLYLTIIFFIITSCTTVEVTKEIIKAGNSVKKTVSEIVPNEKKDNENNSEIIEAEKKVIKIEQQKQKNIVETQQKLAEINFIGKKESQIIISLSEPQLRRPDGSVLMLRYDSNNCRLFLFFKREVEEKRVEYFEIRDNAGNLLNSKQTLEACYREFKLID